MDRKTIAVILSITSIMVLTILLIIEKGKTKTNFELMEDLFIGIDNVEFSDEVDTTILEEARKALLKDGTNIKNYVEIKTDDNSIYKISIYYDEKTNPIIRGVSKEN